MSTRKNDEEKSVAEDAEGGEESSSQSEQQSGFFHNSAIRDALAAQLSNNATLRVNPEQSLPLDALQRMMQGSAFPGANINWLRNLGAAPSHLAGLQAQAALREGRMRLFLQQQQENQMIQQMIQQRQLQQHQQQQQQQNQQVHNRNLLADLAARERTAGTQRTQTSLAQSLGALQQSSANLNLPFNWQSLGGFANRGLNLPMGEESSSLPRLLTGNTMSSLHSNLSSQLPGHAASTAASRDSSSSQEAARMPEAQGQTQQDDQPEMEDAEYFELFGFNDEDGVQIINETFPTKLYRMLFEVEKKGLDHIVSFFPHGKAFIVHQPKRFVEEIMPKYFSTSRMSSFQRQLNLYGFQRIDEGPEKGGFVHQYFQKGQRSLCNKIKRHRNRSQGNVSSSQPETLPGAGRGNLPRQQSNFAALRAAASNTPPAQLSQNQQAQALLQSMLNQQQQTRRSSPNDKST